MMKTLNQIANPTVQRLLHLDPNAATNEELEDLQEQEQTELAVDQKVDENMLAFSFSFSS